MKRSLFHLLGSAILALGFFFTASALAQETIAYPGATLQHVLGVPDSLGPSGSGSGKSNSLSGNSVTLNSGAVNEIHGAINVNDTDPVTNNNVFIKGGMVRTAVDGGHGMITSTGNSVTVSGGTVDGTIIGGHAMNRDDEYKTTVSEDNNVTISGGQVDGSIYGGYSDNPVEEGSASARNNTVTIRGAPTFGSDVKLYGGYANDLVDGTSTGNTLNFHSSGLKVHELYFFQSMNFYLPSTLEAGGTVLTVAEAASIADVTINVRLEGTGPALKTGDRYTLVDAGVLHGDFLQTKGILGYHAYTLQKEDNRLVLIIGEQILSGQWIKDDEDAWGLTVLMNFPGNLRYIFVPWYTYDKDGNAAWYIFQGESTVLPESGYIELSADVYRYTGPNWGAMPYDNSSIDNAKVGTAKLTFTSATTAQFEYDVEGAKRTIDLNRLDGAASVGNESWASRLVTGQWVKVDEDAWGLTVLGGFASKPGYLFVPWYTYDKDGNAAWHIFQGESVSAPCDSVQASHISCLTLEADVYRYTGSPWGTMPYDNSAIAHTKVGTATLTFFLSISPDTPPGARFEYDVDGSKRIIDLRKLD
ncbi:MAG: hypothetical protein LBE32_01560 [Burkholderiales bacterium]|jgi:hypothetical protein|nr:hypothetical protein [Burkholderiales bacterium]